MPSDVSDYQVIGEGNKGGQTSLISGLSEGVLEDKREQEVSRREFSKRGWVGDQERAVVLKWQRKHDGLPNNKGAKAIGRARGR